MKKLVFAFMAMIMLTGGFALFSFTKTETNNVQKTEDVLGKIKIKFHGGTLCWLPGKACEGEIEIEWKGVAPKDAASVKAPKGYSILVMQTELFDKKDLVFEERTFSSKEISNGSEIYIPKQVGKYSKELNAFVLYAKVK